MCLHDWIVFVCWKLSLRKAFLSFSVQLTKRARQASLFGIQEFLRSFHRDIYCKRVSDNIFRLPWFCKLFEIELVFWHVSGNEKLVELLKTVILCDIKVVKAVPLFEVFRKHRIWNHCFRYCYLFPCYCHCCCILLKLIGTH